VNGTGGEPIYQMGLELFIEFLWKTSKVVRVLPHDLFKFVPVFIRVRYTVEKFPKPGISSKGDSVNGTLGRPVITLELLMTASQAGGTSPLLGGWPDGCRPQRRKSLIFCLLLPSAPCTISYR